MIVAPGAVAADELGDRITRMTRTLHHRGPDAGAVWVDVEANIALGHRRLSILDLSPAGAQPMHSASGRYVIVFNGEIYNHLTLRRELEQQSAGVTAWRGHSDTETLLTAIEAWGLEVTLKRSRGMFALALWDRKKGNLQIARDRLGEKPLYYGWLKGRFLFASELKAIQAVPDIDLTVDMTAVEQFLRYSYVPAPLSIYQGIRKLLPGCFLTVMSVRDEAEPKTYWSLPTVYENGRREPLSEDYPMLCDLTEKCLSEVVATQMLSDVPLGCFLSGGVDSSLIAALMQKHAGAAVKTFSIGFDDARFNEAAHAQKVAKHLGTDHTEFTLRETDALAVIRDLPFIYDEPFGDSSQIPTILLSRLTRQYVTVALSGDGGDEIFGGYNRFVYAPKIWRKLKHLPRPGRRLVGSLAISLQARGVREGSLLRWIAGQLRMPITTVDKLSKFGQVIRAADDFPNLYRQLASLDQEPQRLLKADSTGGAVKRTLPSHIPGAEAEWMMQMDALTYLPDDILVKVDRAAMSASLETRTPFIDRDVVELAAGLPISAKIAGDKGKTILRDILFRHVPPNLIERPKQGFSIPLDRWLREDLKDWAEERLNEAELDRAGIWNKKTISQLWSAHKAGQDNAGSRLWNILMLQAWLGHGYN